MGKIGSTTKRVSEEQKSGRGRPDSGITRREAPPQFTEVTYRTTTPNGLLSRLCAFLLFSILFLQPLSVVFADETVPAPVGGDVASVITDAPTVSVVQTSVPVADGIAPQSESVPVAETPLATTPDPVPQPPSESGPIVSPDPAPVSGATDTPEVTGTSTATTPSIDNVEVDTGTSTPTENGGATTTPAETPVVTDPVLLDPATTTILGPLPVDASATVDASTTEATTSSPLVNVAVNDGNRYQFGTNDCVTVEDGFFYCTKKKPSAVDGQDRFYSAQDKDGDLEIFLEKDSTTTQITHNQYDDSAPMYDPVSERLVWHAFINDRYQIMSYDLIQNEMKQLTSETYNSMQPSAEGDKTVWQAWVGDNWEIMLDDGATRTQLTNNHTYDINPHIYGEYVSWQSLTDNAWHAEIYDTKTGKLEIMKTSDGGSVENPRFVLMYDSKNANGDVETVGYDLDKKIKIALGAIPNAIPKEIPQPEHSKEERAIVQSTPTLKEEATSTDDGLGSTTPQIDPPVPDMPESGLGSTTSATSSDIVIPPSVLATSTDLSVPSATQGDASATPLDMRAPTTTDTGFVPTIPDLIIPPTSSTLPESVPASTSSAIE